MYPARFTNETGANTLVQRTGGAWKFFARRMKHAQLCLHAPVLLSGIGIMPRCKQHSASVANNAQVIGSAEDWEAPPVIICGFYAPSTARCHADAMMQSVPAAKCFLLWSFLKEPRGMANGRVYYVMVPEAILRSLRRAQYV